MNLKCFILSLLSLLFFVNLQAQYQEPSGYNVKYDYVDMGLPSGVKWATHNIGATYVQDGGRYIAWGENALNKDTTPKNSKTFKKNMMDISGNPSYDIASLDWCGKWRIPTKYEMEELINLCKWEWTEYSGRKGYKVTGPNGNAIFLPAGGSNSSFFPYGQYGCYWTSTPYQDGYNTEAYYLKFDSSSHKLQQQMRHVGYSIRPVLK